MLQKGGLKNVNYATYQCTLSTGSKILFDTGTGAGGANTGGKSVESSTNLPLSQWNHIAVVWNGTNLVMYQNGVSVGTAAASPLEMGNNSSGVTIGNITGGTDYFVGSLSNIRIVKNVAVYTGAFTVPAVPLTATQSSGTNITAITGTATGLLLNAASSATYLTDSSSYGATISNSNVTWSASGPSVTSTSVPYYRVNNEYDITLLPAQYVGSVATNNLNEGGLQLGRPWVTFLPSDLFAASEKGVWYDPGDITTLFQDVAGTIPVTASGQTVALMQDKSGNNAHATQSDAAKRPTFYIHPGSEYGALSFDGTDDFMVTSAINFTGTAAMTATAGFQVSPTAGTGARFVVELGPLTASTNGSFYMSGPGSLNDHSMGLRGTTSIAASFSNVSGTNDVLTGIFDIGQSTKETEVIPRLNGVVKSGVDITWTGSANAGTGNFGNQALYIGSRAGTTYFFKGYMYSMVVRGATSSAPQVTSTETWVTARLY